MEQPASAWQLSLVLSLLLIVGGNNNLVDGQGRSNFTTRLNLLSEVLDVLNGKTLVQFFSERDLTEFRCRGEKLSSVKELQEAGKNCSPARKGEICQVLCVFQQLNVLYVTEDGIEYEKNVGTALVNRTAPAEVRDDLRKALKKCSSKLRSLDGDHDCVRNVPFVDCLRAMLSQICDIAKLMILPDD